MIVDRNKNSNQLLDTNVAVLAGGKWELAVPNGTYVVKVGIGDSGASSNNNVYVEGQRYSPINPWRQTPLQVSR